MSDASRRWRTYWVCVAIAAVTILDLSKINVALPALEHGLGATSTQLQLVVSGYVLTFGLALVPAGRLGDQVSRRLLFIIGLSVFTGASVLAALAPTAEILLAARLIQGIGAGIQMPQVMGTVQELFQGAERGRAFGLFGATIGLATAFGPTLGGLAVQFGGETDGWRWIFWMNVPLGVAAIVAVLVLLHPDGRARGRVSLDPVGVALFGAAVLALMWPFLFTTGAPTDDPNRWWLLGAFVLLAALFVWWESRYAASGRHPLIPLRLFGLRSFRNGTLIATAYFGAMPALFILTTLFLQNGLALAPVFAGMVSIGFALTSALTSWWSGRMVARYGRRLVVWGLVVMLVATGAMVLLAHVVSDVALPWVFAAVLFLAGAGGGVVISPNQTLTLAEVPVAQGGLAGSVGQLGQRIGAAIGGAVALSLFYATIHRAGHDETRSDMFHDAYTYGMIAVAVLIAVALFAAIADALGRRPDALSGPID